jgi:S-formylglutathione hydrolase
VKDMIPLAWVWWNVGLLSIALSCAAHGAGGRQAHDAARTDAVARHPFRTSTVNSDPVSALLRTDTSAPQGSTHVVSLETTLVPSPVHYAVLLPPGYKSAATPLPLILLLHGGGGDHQFLTDRMKPLIEEAWALGILQPAVVVTPSAGRSFYMDYRDGSQRWEAFILHELLPHLHDTYPVSNDSRKTLITGISMGGMGGLRLALKYPNRFGAVAALEPGIEPAMAYDDIELQDRFWRAEALFEQIYGSPVDREYWKQNNPANIVASGAEAIRKSGLRIYLEVGDEDSFNLQRGTEFLHRVLVDHDVRHGYRWIDGADHTGSTIPARFMYAFAHLNQALSPPPADATLDELHRRIRMMKQRAGLSP